MPRVPAPARPGLPSGSGNGGHRTARAPMSITMDRDRGQALLEPLIALVLTGLVVSPTVGAVQVVVATSAQLADTVSVQTVARDAAARLVAAHPGGCIGAAHLEAMSGATDAVGWPADTVSIVSSARAAPNPDGGWMWATDDCSAPGSLPRRVDILVRSPTGQVRTMTQVVLVDPEP